MRPSRRRVLQLLGSMGAVAIAGCASDDGGDANDASAAGNDSTDDGGAESTPAADAEPESPAEAARQAIELLRAGEYEALYDRFGAPYQSNVTVAAVERTHLGLQAAGGDIQSVEIEDTAVRSGLETVDLAVELERRDATMRVAVTEEFALAGLLVAGEYETASYVDPDSFEATEHTLEPEGCDLGSTLTMPTDAAGGSGSVPGVVIVHGSGPSDRDATTVANKPYRDLAEGLSTRGIAVLRYDKRTYACNVQPAEYTVDRVTVDDALHAIGWLRERDGVASDDVTVLGHSLGAMMAPEIAARDGGLAGAVGLAAPARPLTEVYLDQIRHLATVTEHESPIYGQRRDQWERAAEQIRSGNYDDDELLMGYPGALWRSLAEYDPVERAASLDVEQFYLQGGRDYQVTAEGDFAEWRSAFEDVESVALSAYDPLNHAFLPGQGPSVPAAYGVPNEVSESAIADVAGWIQG